jgi:hypothetical protein
MANLWAFTVSDWFTQGGGFLETLLWIAYVFIIVATGIVGAYLTGFVSRGAAMLVYKDLSRAWVFRTRVLGGLAGALTAYLLLSPGDLGIGRGPGQGGTTGTGTGTGEVKTDQATQPNTLLQPGPGKTTDRAGGSQVLRITLLGDGTEPPWQPRNRFFAIADAPMPEALDVEGVIRMIEERKKSGELREVELVVTRHSTSLQNLEVQRLRRAVEQAGLRFHSPDPDRPMITEPGK